MSVQHGDHWNHDDEPDCGGRHCAGNPACTEKRWRDGSCECPCEGCRTVRQCTSGKRDAPATPAQPNSQGSPKKGAALAGTLCALLLPHVGETGVDESAEEVLRRVLREREEIAPLRRVAKAYLTLFQLASDACDELDEQEGFDDSERPHSKAYVALANWFEDPDECVPIDEVPLPEEATATLEQRLGEPVEMEHGDSATTAEPPRLGGDLRITRETARVGQRVACAESTDLVGVIDQIEPGAIGVGIEGDGGVRWSPMAKWLHIIPPRPDYGSGPAGGSAYEHRMQEEWDRLYAHLPGARDAGTVSLLGQVTPSARTCHRCGQPLAAYAPVGAVSHEVCAEPHGRFLDDNGVPIAENVSPLEKPAEAHRNNADRHLDGANDQPCARFVASSSSPAFCWKCGWHLAAHATELPGDTARKAAGPTMQNHRGATFDLAGARRLATEAKRGPSQVRATLTSIKDGRSAERVVEIGALADLLLKACDEIERPRATPPKALPVGALHKDELPFCGRFYGAVNVDGDDPEPLFLFDEEREAQAELDRRHALHLDHDEYLSDDWRILTFDVEGIFWNSYEPNPRDAPTQSRLWEMQQEIERLQHRLGEAGELYGIARFEEERLRAQVATLTKERAEAIQMLATTRDMLGALKAQAEQANAEVERRVTELVRGIEKERDDARVLLDGERALNGELQREIQRMRPVVEAAAEVMRERIAQDAEWGGPTHDDEHVPADWLQFIAEKTAGVTVRLRYGTMGGTYPGGARGRVDHERSIEPEDLALYRRRLVQIEALALAARQSFDRKAKASS